MRRELRWGFPPNRRRRRAQMVDLWNTFEIAENVIGRSSCRSWQDSWPDGDHNNITRLHESRSMV